MLACGHGDADAPFPRVLLDGQPVVTMTSPYAIAGCAFDRHAGPPCVTGQWLVGAPRVLAGGAPVASMTGSVDLRADRHADAARSSRRPAWCMRDMTTDVDFPYHFDGRGRTATTDATTTSAT